jgi:2-hydroxyglutarate dehydrogenase
MQCLLQRHSTALKCLGFKRCYSVLPKPELEVDNLVIGGGVVGLALAERLARQRAGESTILVERHSRVGEETRYVV